jgi:hypothetical protein
VIDLTTILDAESSEIDLDAESSVPRYVCIHKGYST